MTFSSSITVSSDTVSWGRVVITRNPLSGIYTLEAYSHSTPTYASNLTGAVDQLREMPTLLQLGYKQHQQVQVELAAGPGTTVQLTILACYYRSEESDPRLLVDRFMYKHQAKPIDGEVQHLYQLAVAVTPKTQVEEQ